MCIIFAYTIFHINLHILGRLMNTTKKTLLVVISCIFYLFLSVTSSFADETVNPEGTMDNPDQLLYESDTPSAEAAPTDMTDDTTMGSDLSESSGVNSEASVYYTVKKGDTLWDLSQRFNNSAWQWPGMWSDNKQLTNPHLIYPGQKLKLFFRSDMDRLRQLQAKAEEESMTSEGVDVAEPEESDKVVEPVEPVELSDTKASDSDKDSNIKLPFYHYSKIGSIGFMTPKPAVDHGYIFKVKGIERLVISKGDEIFIKETNDKSLIPGAKYFTYRVTGSAEVKKKIKMAKKLSVLGIGRKTYKTVVETQHYITGIVQITSIKSGYAEGKIIQSYRSIHLKDFVIPFVYRSPDVTLTAAVEGMTGAIISSEENEGTFGDGTVAFIDKGSKDGIQPGQMYNVFYPEKKDSAEFFGGQNLFVPVDFGTFIVLLTEESVSTVLVTSAYQGISSGDLWHYPQE